MVLFKQLIKTMVFNLIRKKGFKLDEQMERSYRNFFVSYPDIVSVDDLSQMLGICKVKAYKLVKEGVIKSVKIGNIYRIPKKAILQYVESAC